MFDARFREMYGLRPDEQPGDAIWDLIHPDDLPHVRAAVAAAKDPGGQHDPASEVMRPPPKAVSTLLSAIDDEPDRIKAPYTTATASPSEVSVR